MKITLKYPLNWNGVDIETQNATLGALLRELSTNNTLKTSEFFDRESGEIYPDCDVCINGQPYRALADGLDTRLKDNDTVEIIMIVLPGG